MPPSLFQPTFSDHGEYVRREVLLEFGTRADTKNFPPCLARRSSDLRTTASAEVDAALPLPLPSFLSREDNLSDNVFASPDRANPAQKHFHFRYPGSIQSPPRRPARRPHKPAQCPPPSFPPSFASYFSVPPQETSSPHSIESPFIRNVPKSDALAVHSDEHFTHFPSAAPTFPFDTPLPAFHHNADEASHDTTACS